MFGAASLTTHLTLRRRLPGLLTDLRQRRTVRVWLMVYAFVGIQLGWVLRPFVGVPGGDPAFVRLGEAWGNAYVVVWTVARRALLG